MKIHSKFNDYYDSAMAHGVDDHVHWVRNTSEIIIGGPSAARQLLFARGKGSSKIDVIPVDGTFVETDMYNERPIARSRVPFGSRVSWSKHGEPDRENCFIGFCGKIYLGFRFTWDDSRTGMDEPVIRHAYTVEDITKILKEYDKAHKTTNAAHFVKDRDMNQSGWSDRFNFNKRSVAEYLKRYATPEHVKFFVDLNTPVFVVLTDSNGYARLEVNPVLKDYDFQKVMDPYTAYQEIEMFMGGVLATLDEINVPGVGDEDLKVGKGFDEWSFKTMPTKHRGK